MRTVLIIDDVPCVAQLRPHLSPLGFKLVQVLEADQGPRAIEDEAPDLVLLDLHFPEDRRDAERTTGGRLHTILRRDFPHIPVLIFSTRTEDDSIAPESLDVESFGRINKPDVRVAGWAETFAARLDRAISSFSSAGEEPFASFGFHIGRTQAMRGLVQALSDVAPRRHPVLLRGETGVGKRLAARALHQLSRRPGNFVILDKAASGIGGGRRALADFFAEAGRGTLLLAGIDDLEDALQATLLGLIDEHGNDAASDTSESVRVIATTSRPLETRIVDGDLRAELYYRLRSCELRLPPLRERLDDIPALFGLAIDRYNATATIPMSRHLRPETQETLAAYAWPGNIREFESAVRTAATRTQNETLLPTDFSGLADPPVPSSDAALTRSMNEDNPLIADARTSFELIRSLPPGPARYEALKETRSSAIPIVMQLIIDDILATTGAMLVKREQVPYYLLGEIGISNQDAGSINSFTSKRGKWQTLRKTPFVAGFPPSPTGRSVD